MCDAIRRGVGHSAHCPHTPGFLHEGGAELTAMLVNVADAEERVSLLCDGHLLIILIGHTEGIGVAVVEVIEDLIGHICLVGAGNRSDLLDVGLDGYLAVLVELSLKLGNRLDVGVSVVGVEGKLAVGIEPNPIESARVCLDFFFDFSLCESRECSVGLTDKELALGLLLVGISDLLGLLQTKLFRQGAYIGGTSAATAIFTIFVNEGEAGISSDDKRRVAAKNRLGGRSIVGSVRRSIRWSAGIAVKYAAEQVAGCEHTTDDRKDQKQRYFFHFKNLAQSITHIF